MSVPNGLCRTKTSGTKRLTTNLLRMEAMLTTIGCFPRQAMFNPSRPPPPRPAISRIRGPMWWSANWNGSTTGNVTTVGSAGPLSESYYGTADQAGNVWNWYETIVLTSVNIIDEDGRGIWGGSWANNPSNFRADHNVSNLGFRVARYAEPTTVPEPSSGMLLVGLAAIATLVRFRPTREIPCSVYWLLICPERCSACSSLREAPVKLHKIVAVGIPIPPLGHVLLSLLAHL